MSPMRTQIKAGREKISDSLNQYFELAPPKNFEEWCLKPHLNSPNSYSTKQIVEGTKLDIVERDSEAFIQRVVTAGEKVQPHVLIGANTFAKEGIFDFSENEIEKFIPKNITAETKYHIPYLELTGESNLIFKNAVIGKVNIAPSAVNQPNITFENCCIRSIEVSSFPGTNIELINCLLGKFKSLTKNALNNLLVDSSWICYWFCTPPQGESPISGSVSFLNAKFPSSNKRSKLFQGPQQYKNLRSHLEKLNNNHASAKMRERELASEREIDKGVSKFFNWIYYLASNYGLKPGKSLLWVLFLYLVMVGIIFSWDGGETRNDPSSLKGWEVALSNKTSSMEKLKRSIILPAQSMFNPVGAFRSNQILIPKKGWVKFLLIPYGFLSDGLLLFFIFGLRKRFKLH